MTQRLAPILALFVLIAPDVVHAEPPAKPYVPQYRSVARWYGEMAGQQRSYPSREPGGFAYSPNSVQKTRVRVVLREEVDDSIGEQRTVVESLSWASSVDDLYYQNKDGSRVGAGTGGSGSGAYSEEQLLGNLQPPRPEEVQRLLRLVEEGRVKVEEAEREKAEAEKAETEAALRKTQTAPPPKELSQAIEHSYQASREFRDRHAAGQQSDEALARVEKAREALRAAREKHYEQITQQYLPRMQQLTELLQDPKASDAQKARAVEEVSRLSEAHDAAFASLRNGDSAVEGLESAKDRLESAKAELESARRWLREQEANWHEAHNRRVLRARATVGYREDAKSRKRTVSIEFRVDDEKLREFPIKVIELEKVGAFFSWRVGPERTEIARASLPRSHGISFRGKAEMRNPDDPVTIRFSDQGQAWSVTSTFTRVPVKQQLLVRGQVLHRIRIPKSAIDLNVIRASDSVGSLEGAIPVAGQVKLEAWLADANTAIPSNQPPDVVGSTRDDGRFEVGLPSAPGKRLRLRFVYHNADAQLTEYNTMEIPTDQIINAAGTTASGAAALPDIVRTTVGFFRFGNSPMEYPVGTESRGAAVRREDGQTILQFVGLNAILINGFIIRTPYLNQNLQGFSVAGVKVPAARLLAARPDFVSEATVRSHLELPPTGDPPAEVETDVMIRGTVVCFPTSVTMALAALGLVDVQDRAARADQVRDLAQGIYNFHAQRSRASSGPRRHPEPPWVFPFPDDPGPFNRAGDEAFQNLLRRIGRVGDITELARDWSNLHQTHRAYLNWPFMSASTNDLAKQWLISLDSGRYSLWVETSTGAEFLELEQFSFRPWQFPDIMKDYLHAEYGVKSRVLDKSDPFGEAQKVVNLLGRGGTAILSIDHRDSEKRKGGHIVLLVGAIIDNLGDIVRLIVHDPYGDQTRNPGVEGYYNPADMTDKSKYDKDSKEGWGAYAPYAREIDSFGGRLYGKYWMTFEPPTGPSVQKLRDRLVPSELPSGSIPAPSQ